MSTYFFATGKHPKLSIAELKSRYPGVNIKTARDGFVLLETDIKFDQKEFNHLGGSIKAAKVLKDVKKDELISGLADFLSERYQGSKLDYGLSIYGVSEKQLRPILLKLKKRLRSQDIKSRFINKNFQNITAAQFKSIRQKGIELVIVRDGGRFLIGEVSAVQDIDSYSKRDFDKPFRDMQMGMLPPKLAQILINLTGVRGKIWDPFCGSGTIIMEGLLMGQPMMGSDINPDYIDGAKKNIAWLKKEFNISSDATLFVHDATKSLDSTDFDAIACESFLGMPHNQFIKPEKLNKIIEELDGLYFDFFSNLKQMKCHVPIVIALPFFRLRNGQEETMQKSVEKIEELGFKRSPLLPNSFKTQNRFELKYSRSNQAVGRAIYKFLLK